MSGGEEELHLIGAVPNKADVEFVIPEPGMTPSASAVEAFVSAIEAGAWDDALDDLAEAVHVRSEVAEIPIHFPKPELLVTWLANGAYDEVIEQAFEWVAERRLVVKNLAAAKVFTPGMKARFKSSGNAHVPAWLVNRTCTVAAITADGRIEVVVGYAKSVLVVVPPSMLVDPFIPPPVETAEPVEAAADAGDAPDDDDHIPF
jgi:hypothetical protein